MARVRTRLAGPGDDESVRSFLTGLSAATRLRRFFNGQPRISAALIRHLIENTLRQLVLLALDDDVVIGHAMAVWDGEHTLDIAVVVADAHQCQGIGTRLLHELATVAAHLCDGELRCDVLSENYAVRRWLNRELPGIRFQRSGDTMTGRWTGWKGCHAGSLPPEAGGDRRPFFIASNGR